MDREPIEDSAGDHGPLVDGVLEERREGVPESDVILPDNDTHERKPPRHSRITEAAKRLGHDLWSERVGKGKRKDSQGPRSSRRTGR